MADARLDELRPLQRPRDIAAEDGRGQAELAVVGDADRFFVARLYTVAGMNHCSGGPTADQFDMLTPMIAWVEQGKVPDSVTATARDASNEFPNSEVPADWGAGRTRPLCPYPKVVRYKGGDVNSAASFTCG